MRCSTQVGSAFLPWDGFTKRNEFNYWSLTSSESGSLHNVIIIDNVIYILTIIILDITFIRNSILPSAVKVKASNGLQKCRWPFYNANYTIDKSNRWQDL